MKKLVKEKLRYWLQESLSLTVITLALAGIAAFAFSVIAYELKLIASLNLQIIEQNNQMGLLQEQLKQLKTENAAAYDTGRHIAVSLKENKLYLMEGRDAVRTIKVATGSGRKIQKFGREFEFVTPTGRFPILKKDVDPIWYAPDWDWIERGETVPEDLTMQDRARKGVMGKYALRLGDGIAIHGTDKPWTIGQYATHGCVRVGAKDLEILFNSVDTGTVVYIY